MASAEKDPISQVYDSLWDLAEASKPLTQLVLPRNRIKWNSKSFTPPDKTEVSDSDLPELALVVSQLTGRLRANSSSSMIMPTFEWWISTGDVNVQRAMMPVMFALFAAMSQWPTMTANGPTAFTWRGQPFIKRVDLNNAQCGVSDPQKNRGVRGWSCIWSCEVETWVSTSDLADFSQGN